MSLLRLPSENDFALALQALKQGGIVAYPTETFYGLAVDPANEQAIAALFTLKGRERNNPLSLLVPSMEQLFSLVSSVQEPYEKLIDNFWPGPLTLIFPARENVSPLLTGGGTTIAIRISSHPVAQQFCTMWGGAITATSANFSGEPALVTAGEVAEHLGEQVSFILDGGTSPGGKGSTIVRCVEKEKECQILRQGVIAEKDLSEVLPFNYRICKS